MSTELLAKETGCGPICDNCQTALGFHGDTFAGAGCDMDLALKALWRALNIAVFGEDRYWDAKRRFEQLDTTLDPGERHEP